MIERFTGPLGPTMLRYLELRRSLGSILRNAEQGLDDFDRYLAEHFPEAETVSRPMVTGYLASLAHLERLSLCDRVSCLRQFCRFLHQLNPDTYIPERSLVPAGTTRRKPHIYSERELALLLEEARRLPPASSLRPHTYATIIALLWVSGLRISEVLRLNLGDVDLGAGILHVRQTKFSKSRLVPLAPSTTLALRRYLEARAARGHDQSPHAPFFVNERARRCNCNTVQRTFLDMVRRVGFKTAQGTHPRLHDFRHTFATLTLGEFYRGGKDPGACLPLLATYLGHANISHTQVYLHPSTHLLEAAGTRFREHSRGAGSLALEARDEG